MIEIESLLLIKKVLISDTIINKQLAIEKIIEEEISISCTYNKLNNLVTENTNLKSFRNKLLNDYESSLNKHVGKCLNFEKIKATFEKIRKSI